MSSVLLTETEKFSNSTDHICDDKWKTWCRLCANDDVHGINIVSGQSSQVPINGDITDINIVHSIGELFRVHVRVFIITSRNLVKIYYFIDS